MGKRKFDILLLTLVTLVSTLLVWLPFGLFKIGNGMLTVFANYDGPNYLIIAKTLYNKTLISRMFSAPSPLEYYPAHLPGFPLLVKFTDYFFPGTWALLFSTLFTTVLAVVVFYLFIKKFHFSASPLFLSLVFLFLPARWLVVRNVGSAEPLFIFAILASFYFFRDRRYWLAALFGIIAQVTKTPGILLFISYLIILAMDSWKTKKIPWKAYPLLLIPLSIIPIFLLYQFQVGDFWAYFHSGDNFHLVFPPFQSFVTGRNWLGDFWLEDMVWQYLIGALAVVQLFKLKHYDLATFTGVFFTATLFIAHRDLARYSLPIMPFALIAFAPFLEKKEFKIVFLFILIPTYLYTINFMLHNVAPIADWTPYL